MDWNKTDFFSKKISNARSFKRRQQNHLGIRIVLIVLGLWIFGVYKLFYADPVLKEVDQQEKNTFSLGTIVALEGELRADGDLMTHTHTLTTSNSWIIFIKSSQENGPLGEYTGTVSLTGKVEKFYQEKPIVEVITLSGTLSNQEKDEPDVVLDKNSGVYYPSAWLQFLPSFFDKYLLLNEGENGEFLIQNLDTNQQFTLEYFRCNESDPNKNCKGFVDLFSQSSRSFVTANGDVYYKQSEVNSWFVSNGNRWGIFINDVSEEEVMQLKDYIVFANEKIMKNWLDFAATRICQDDEESLKTITDSQFTLKQSGLVATISGEGTKHLLTCEIKVDFSLPKKGELISLSKNGEKVQIVPEEKEEKIETPSKKEEKSDSSSKEPSETESKTPSQEEPSKSEEPTWQEQLTQRNPNVPQFPINPEKGLKYARKWNYTVNFSSSNIAYAASSVKEKFGNDDINCTYVVNVIKYADRDNVETSPDIRIYECMVKNPVSASTLWENFVIKEAADRTFIIQIINPAWVDFANALSFDSAEE